MSDRDIRQLCKKARVLVAVSKHYVLPDGSFTDSSLLAWPASRAIHDMCFVTFCIMKNGWIVPAPNVVRCADTGTAPTVWYCTAAATMAGSMIVPRSWRSERWITTIMFGMTWHQDITVWVQPSTTEQLSSGPAVGKEAVRSRLGRGTYTVACPRELDRVHHNGTWFGLLNHVDPIECVALGSSRA